MKVYKLSEQELRNLQMIELEMLYEVDRICRKRKIRYNIVAGTLLGAVRHGGFIPWDDDADVGLLRPEYERFKKACKKDLDTERFVFQDISSTEGYRWGYGKLRRKNTLFLRNYQEDMKYHQGIFLDIFPLDSVPSGKIAEKIHTFQCFLIRKLMWAPVGVKAEKVFWKKAVYSLIQYYPEKQLKKLYQRFVRYSNQKYACSPWVKILTFPSEKRPRKWYEKSRIYYFEGKPLQGIYDYEDYLSFSYGNWRKLPEEKDRVTHPVSALRLLPLTQELQGEGGTGE